MRLFLMILAFSQFQGYEQKPDGAFRVSPEVIRIQQISNDQVNSIISDYLKDDQIPMRSQEGSSPGRPTQNMYQPLPSQQQFENAQSRVISPDAAQDYTDFQRGQDYPTQGGYQRTADNYNVANQNYGSSPAQAAKNYPPQQMSLDIPTNYQTSEHGPVSAAVPGVRPGYMPSQTDYRLYNEIPQSTAAYRGLQPQMTPQNYQVYRNDDRQDMQPAYQGAQQNQPNYHAVNQDGREEYTQATWAGPQQNPQGYQLVNKNSDAGIVTISLPDNEDAAQGGYNTQRQGQQQPQFVNGYQVINEGPVHHTVSTMAPGSKQNPPQMPANYNSAASVNPQDGYMPLQNTFYPQQIASDLAGGQYGRQSQNEVYPPYLGSYNPQDQQREEQYEMWKPQQPAMQMPFPYLDGNKESDNFLNMINNQLTGQTRRIVRNAIRF